MFSGPMPAMATPFDERGEIDIEESIEAALGDAGLLAVPEGV
jgi:dihydrodipicolinate synthase/N-acetylneuraminate lyase